MELKLARTELDAKPKTITFEKLLEAVRDEGQKMVYFDKANSHKDLMEAVRKLEEEGLSVYFREVRYGLDDEDYMYQAHLL